MSGITAAEAQAYFRNEGLPVERVNPAGYRGPKELLAHMVVVQIAIQKRERPLDLSGEAYP